MCAIFIRGNFKTILMENYKKPEVTYEIDLKARTIGGKYGYLNAVN